MSSRRLAPVLALAAVAGCKGPRSADPEPGPPDAEQLAAFDPAALAEGGPPTPAPAAPLAVLDYGPQGRTEGGTDIRIRFNQPVLPLGSETVPELAGLVTLDPPVDGRAFFQTPDLLVFRPAAPLAPATTYTVRFAAGFTSAFGQRLAQGLEWTLETPRPRVAGAAPYDHGDERVADVRRDSPVIVEFDHPTTLAEVRAHLQASARPLDGADAPARPVAVRITPTTRAEAERAGYYHYDEEAQRGRRYTVRPQGLWPGASTISLAVTPGLKGTLGPLPLDTPWDMSFATYGPQRVTTAGCRGEARCGLEPISLTLRNPVRAREAGKISVSPRPKFLKVEVVDAWDDAGGREVVIEGQFAPGTTYTVRVAPGLKDIYGQSLPGGFSREVVFERRPELALSSASGTLIPARKQTIGVEARFVEQVRVRWAVVGEAELALRPWQEIGLPAAAKERTIALKPRGAGGWASLALDLADLTGGARGPVLVDVEAVGLAANATGGPPARRRGLYRLTDLGPVAVASLTQTAVQVLRLSDSAPVAGARVSRVEGGPKDSLRELGVTDADGLLKYTRTPLPAGSEVRRETIVVDDPATGDRTALEIGGALPEAAADAELRAGERLIARIVADRGAYRPGERVKVVGWSAVDTPFARSGLGRLPQGTEVKFTLTDPFGAVVARKTARTTAEGKYWAELPIPGEGKLGRYKVTAALAGDSASETVKVEDYRVPEFSVTASVKQRDLLTGQRPNVRVTASYYFGGAVPIARLTLQSSCWPERYRPPGLDAAWAVGEAYDYRHAHPTYGPRRSARARPEDRPGLVELETETGHSSDAYPHRCTISAEVQDASLQGVGAEAGVLLHPAPFYLAIGAPPGRKQAGDRVSVPLRAVEIAGARVAAKGVKAMVERTWSEAQYKAEGGRQVFAGYVEKSEKVTTCAVDLAAAGEDARCELPPLKEGQYTVRAVADAGDGREARSEAGFWVARASRYAWVPSAPQPRLTVQASASKVTPGEVVEVAVQTPWKGGRGLLALDRQGVREIEAFAPGDGPSTFRFTADDSWTPAVHVRAFAVMPLASAPGKVRPELQTAEAVIDQDAEHRRLQVRVAAPAKAGPGDRVELAASVRDVAGAPVAARVALWAVDEAVLALTDYAVPDLLPSFVPRKGAGSYAREDYRSVLLPYVPVDDPWMSALWGWGGGSGYGSGRGSSAGGRVMGGAASVVPAARERFETTPIFLADLAADDEGEARVKATLPENLTTFRIFAVASARLADGTSPGRFGVGDARTTVTTPFLVRAATPRQLRPGDVAEVRAIVQNFTEADGTAAVELVLHDDPKTPGQDLMAMSPRTAEVAVPAGGQAFVPFQIRADARGEARLELRARLKSAAGAAGRDAVKVALPVEPERTLTERVAMYGSVTDDRAIAVPVALPGAVRPDVGGVTVSASASLLGGLEDAVDALINYPYGCVEQTSSRLLPVVALYALHKDYPLGLGQDPRAFVKAGVERLLAMQTREGGFAYWPGGQTVHPYASAYATWVLWLADQAGYPVPEDALGRALADLERRIGEVSVDAASPWGHDQLARVALGLHVLAEAGRPKRELVDAAFVRRANLPAFGRAFLLMAMHRADPQRPEVQTLSNELQGDLEELPATAHTIERVQWDWGPYFHSDGRSDAIVLAALLRARPDAAVIEKLARGLLERRIGGKWRNTQENAYALVALAEYARAREAEVPDFVARAWVGRKPVFEASFLGRDLKTHAATAAMPEILRPAAAAATAPAPLTVVLQRQGQGRMYYRLGAEWAPADPRPPAREHGLVIARRLRLADGPLADRAIQAGDPVAVDLTLSAETRIRYVALDIPIPAGLEAVQLDLGKGQRASTLSGPRGWWVSHQELRSDRVVVFADDLPPGTHRHTVYLRATSRGEFTLPPAFAEAMYMPEVWGRSEGARVSVR